MPRLNSKSAKQQRKQSPSHNQFTCIDASQGEVVYKYFDSLLDEAAASRFEEHLILCFRCQDIVFDLDDFFQVLEENREIIFPEPAVEASTTGLGSPMNPKRVKRNPI